MGEHQDERVTLDLEEFPAKPDIMVPRDPQGLTDLQDQLLAKHLSSTQFQVESVNPRDQLNMITDTIIITIITITNTTTHAKRRRRREVNSTCSIYLKV